MQTSFQDSLVWKKTFHLLTHSCLVFACQGFEGEGAFSVEIPLPNPTQQDTMKQLFEGLQSALNTPISLDRPSVGTSRCPYFLILIL